MESHWKVLICFVGNIHSIEREARLQYCKLIIGYSSTTTLIIGKPQQTETISILLFQSANYFEIHVHPIPRRLFHLYAETEDLPLVYNNPIGAVDARKLCLVCKIITMCCYIRV